MKPFDRNAWLSQTDVFEDERETPAFDRDAWLKQHDEIFGVEDVQERPVELPPPPSPTTPEDTRLAKVTEQAEQAAALRDQNSFLKDTWSSIKRGRARQKMYELLAEAGSERNEDLAAQAKDQIRKYETAVLQNPIEATTKLGAWWYQAMNSVGGGMAESMAKTLAVDVAVTAGATAMASAASLLTAGPDPTDVVTFPSVWMATARAIRGLGGFGPGLTAASRAAKFARVAEFTSGLTKAGVTAENAARMVRLGKTARTVSDIANFAVITSQWAKQGKGEIMMELMDRNIDPSIRESVSTLGGFIIGVIENLGIVHAPLDIASSVAGAALKKAVANNILKAVGAMIGRYGIEVVKESFENFLQEGVVTTGTNRAVRQQIDKLAMDGIAAELAKPEFQMISGADQLKRSWEAFTSSLGPMAILAGFGGAPGVLGGALRAQETGMAPPSSQAVEQANQEFSDNVRALYAENSSPEHVAAREALFNEETEKWKKILEERKVVGPFTDTSTIVESLDEAETYDRETGRLRPLTDQERYAWQMVRAYEMTTTGRESIFVANMAQNAMWTDRATFYDLTKPETAALSLFLHEGLSHEIYMRSGVGEGNMQSSGNPEVVARGKQIRETLDSVFNFIVGSEETNAHFHAEMERIRQVVRQTRALDVEGQATEEFRARVMETFITDEDFHRELLASNPALFSRLWAAIKNFFDTMRSFMIGEARLTTKTKVESPGMYSEQQLAWFFGDQIVDARNAMLAAAKLYLAGRAGVTTEGKAAAQGIETEVAEEEAQPEIDAGITGKPRQEMFRPREALQEVAELVAKAPTMAEKQRVLDEWKADPANAAVAMGLDYGVEIRVGEHDVGGEGAGGRATVGADATPVRPFAADWTKRDAPDFQTSREYPQNQATAAHEIVHSLFSRNPQTAQAALESLIAQGVPRDQAFESLVDLGGLYLLEPRAITDAAQRRIIGQWLDQHIRTATYKISPALERAKQSWNVALREKLRAGEKLEVVERVMARRWEKQGLIEAVEKRPEKLVAKPPEKPVKKKVAKEEEAPKPENRQLYYIEAHKKLKLAMLRPSDLTRYKIQPKAVEKLETVTLVNKETEKAQEFKLVKEVETVRARYAWTGRRQLVLKKSEWLTAEDVKALAEEPVLRKQPGTFYMTTYNPAFNAYTQVKVKNLEYLAGNRVRATPLEAGPRNIEENRLHTFPSTWHVEAQKRMVKGVIEGDKLWITHWEQENIPKLVKSQAAKYGAVAATVQFEQAAQKRLAQVWAQVLASRDVFNAEVRAELRERYFEGNRGKAELYTETETVRNPDGSIKDFAKVPVLSLYRRALFLKHGPARAVVGAAQRLAAQRPEVAEYRPEVLGSEQEIEASLEEELPKPKGVTEPMAETPVVGPEFEAGSLEEKVYEMWKGDWDTGSNPSYEEVVTAQKEGLLGDVDLDDVALAVRIVRKSFPPSFMYSPKNETQRRIKAAVRRVRRIETSSKPRPDVVVAGEVEARMNRFHGNLDDLLEDYRLAARKRRRMRPDTFMVYGEVLAVALQERGKKGDELKFREVVGYVNRHASDTGRALRQARGDAAADMLMVSFLSSFANPLSLRRDMTAAEKMAVGFKFHQQIVKVVDYRVAKDMGGDSLDVPDSLKRAIEARKNRILDAIFTDLGGFPENLDMGDDRVTAAFVRAVDSHTAHAWDKAIEWWKCGILSGLGTIFQNPASNLAFTLYEYGPKGFISNTLQKVMGAEEALSPAESRVLWGALAGNMGKAFQIAKWSWITGLPALTRQGWGTKVDPQSVQFAIKDQFGGRFVRYPYRALTSADEFFKHLVLRAEVTVGVFKEMTRDAKAAKGKVAMSEVLERVETILREQDGPIWERASQKALLLTWQNEPVEFAKGILSFKKQLGPVGEFAVPFVTVPMNILTQGLKRSPLGIIAMAGKAIKTASKKGGYWDVAYDKFDKKQFADDLAEQLLAWGALVALAALVGDPDDPDKKLQISGALPVYATVPAGKGRFERVEYMRPMSIKAGKTIFDYSRLEPFATIMPPIVDSVRLFFQAKKGKPAMEAIGEAWGRTAMAMTDKTFMGYLKDMGEAAQNPDELSRFAQNFAAGWMPNIFRSLARASDPYERDITVAGARNTKEWYISQGKMGLHAALPFDKGDMAPRPLYDYWGRPVRKAGEAQPSTDLFFRLLGAAGFKTSLAKEDRLSLMILRWNNTERYKPANFKSNPLLKRREPGDPYYPQKPARYIEHKGEQIYLTDEQYNQYTKIIGEASANIARNVTFNIDNPTATDVAILKKVRERGRKIAKARLLSQIIKER